MINLGDTNSSTAKVGNSNVIRIYKGINETFPFTNIENFETTSRFTSGATSGFSRSTDTAATGSYSLYRPAANAASSQVWDTSIALTMGSNKTYCVWVRIRNDRTTVGLPTIGLSTGSANLGMQVMIDDRSGNSALILRKDWLTTSQGVGTTDGSTIVKDVWYLLTMKLETTNIVGRLYNRSGTLLDTVTRASSYANGYLSIGAFSGSYLDNIGII